MSKAGLKLAIENELRPGEEVLWAGLPDPDEAYRSSLKLLFFAIPWTAFALFWEFNALQMAFSSQDDSWFFRIAFPLFGLPFVAIGVGMLYIPHFTYKNSKKTAYVITPDRIFTIALSGSGNPLVTIYSPEGIKRIDKKEKPGGRGTLTINFGYEVDSDGESHEKNLVFYGIANVNEVERIISEKLINARKTRSGCVSGDSSENA